MQRSHRRRRRRVLGRERPAVMPTKVAVEVNWSRHDGFLAGHVDGHRLLAAVAGGVTGDDCESVAPRVERAQVERLPREVEQVAPGLRPVVNAEEGGEVLYGAAG